MNKLEKRIVCALALIFIALTVESCLNGHFYEREAYARRVDATTIAAKDLSGNVWEYECEEDDEFTHGWVVLKMDDKGTERICDDEVVGVKER